MTSGMCASYTETYQSYEVVTPAKEKYWYEPSTNSILGSFCYKNKYARVVNQLQNGKVMEDVFCTYAGGTYPTYAAYLSACKANGGTGPEFEAACWKSGNGFRNGYVAPCGSTTVITPAVYGYVPRTRVTSYVKEAGCLSSTMYDTSDNSVSTH